MVKEIEYRTGKPIDSLDIKIVRRPEPEVNGAAQLGRYPKEEGREDPP